MISIEDFETAWAGSPTTGLYLTWDTFNSVTVSRVASNVTEGTYSWKLEGGPPDFSSGIITDIYDASSFFTGGETRLFVDLTIATIDAGDQVWAFVNDGVTDYFAETAAGATGAVTLEIDLTGADLTQFSFTLFVVGYDTGFPSSVDLNGAYEVYIDNLRAGDGAPANEYILTCNSGTYTVSGQSAGLITTRLIIANSGAYVVTGQNAGLARGAALIANAGSYAVSGQQVNLYANRVLIPDTGSYTISGQQSGLSIARKLIAEAGAYIISGQDAILDFVSAVTGVIDYVITFRRRRR